MSQADIDAFVSLVRGKEAKDLGPSFAAVNRLSMPDMLQAFEQLNPQERDRFRQAAFDGIPGQGTLPQSRQVGIARIEFAFRVVVDKKVPGPEKIPDDVYVTGQFRDACAFLKTPPPVRNVWMTIIGGVCEDAALRKKGEEGGRFFGVPTIMGGDATYGQAGWDVGIKYGTMAFDSTPGLITKRCKGFLLQKLAVNAHGDAGEVAVNGVDEKAIAFQPQMTAKNLDKFSAVIGFLDKVMIADGILLFQSCLAGNGSQGSEFLTRLSLQLRPRKVVAFSKLGYTDVHEQRRGGGAVCIEPGVRDTNYPLDPGPESRFARPKTDYEKYHKTGDWEDQKKLPWQSETSWHAKVAQNGVIIRGADL